MKPTGIKLQIHSLKRCKKPELRNGRKGTIKITTLRGCEDLKKLSSGSVSCLTTKLRLDRGNHDDQDAELSVVTELPLIEIDTLKNRLLELLGLRYTDHCMVIFRINGLELKVFTKSWKWLNHLQSLRKRASNGQDLTQLSPQILQIYSIQIFIAQLFQIGSNMFQLALLRATLTSL